MSDKKIEEILAKMKELDPKESDIAQSSEMKELEQALHERHDDTAADTSQLKDDAQSNKKANALQIAKEVIMFNVERKDRAKTAAVEKQLIDDNKKQRKHNTGAKVARELILEQNQQIIKKLDGLDNIQKTVSDTQSASAQTDSKLAADSEQIKKTADKTTISGSGKKLDTKDKRSGYGMSDADYAAQYDRDQAALKRERNVTDIHDLGKNVKTTDKSLNKQKITGDELSGQWKNEGGMLTFKEGEQLRIGGKNIKRAGDYTTGTAKFRDADTNKFTATDPVKALAEDVRISQGLVGTTRSGSQFRASEGAAELSKNIGYNAAEVQKALDNNEAAQGSLSELTAAFSAMQTGKGTKKDVMEKIEKLKKTGGEELAGKLGLDSVADKSQGGFLKNLGTGIKTNFLGINAGTDILSKKGLGEAFGADRFFGKAGTGKLANVEGLQGRLQFQENVQQGFEIESQKDAMERMQGDEGLGLTGDPKETWEDKKKKEWSEQYGIGTPGGDVVQIDGTSGESVAQASETLEAAGTGAAGKQSKREKLVSGRSGTSKDSDKPATEETLQKILEQLEQTASGGGGGGGGMFPPVGGGGKNKGKGKGKGGRFARGAKGLLKGAARFGGPLAAVAGVGAGIYTAVSGSREAEAMADAGQLTAEEEQVAKGEAIGEGTGGAGGAIAGAAAGAAIGSVVPVVGTAIGGLIGGAIGYFGGSWLGKKAGGKIADAIPVSASELEESNAQADTAMRQIEDKDSALAGKIKQEAKQIEDKLLKEAGEDISDNDKAAIKNAAIVKALMNNEGEIQAIGGVDRTDLDFEGTSASAAVFNNETFQGPFGTEVSEMDRATMEGGMNQRYNIFNPLAAENDEEFMKEHAQILKDTGLSEEEISRRTWDAVHPNSPRGSIESSVSPTGQAVDNMTRLGKEADTMDSSAPVVVNNTTQAPAAPKADSKVAVAIGSPGVRNNYSTIERYYDRRMV